MANLTRNFAVLILCAASWAWASCGSSGAESRPSVAEVKRRGKESPVDESARAAYSSPVRLAVLEDRAVRESSGIAASRLNPGVFWTHNDSGDGPFLYAFDRAGKSRGVWKVAGAKSLDWEDIAAGPGPERGRPYLYVGDIGDNGRGRGELTVYRLPEPATATAGARAAKKGEAGATETAEAIRIKYPDGRHDAEALMVHPLSGDIYVVTKTIGGAAGVYKLRAPYSSSTLNTLERVGEVRVPGIFGGLVTGGDVSPDGRRVVLCDYVRAYELSLPGGDAAAFDDVWKQTPLSIDLGERAQGEAVCYGADGLSVLATSEKRPSPLIEARRL